MPAGRAGRWMPATPGFWGVLAALLLAGSWPNCSGTPRRVAGEVHDGRERAEVALREARALRLRGRQQAALRAYGEVQRDFADQPSVVAEAGFRAAEVLRANGDLEAAHAAFDAVRSLAGEHPFGARATLELAHVDRRRGALREALACYSRLLGADVPPALTDEARYWAGRCSLDLGRLAEAREHFHQVAENAVNPTSRVRGYDAWMSACLRAHDLEGAAGVWRAAHAALAPLWHECTERGARVRSAYERMQSPARLVDAVRERFARGPETHAARR